MLDWLTEEEAAELLRRAKHLHTQWNLGGAYPLGKFVVDCGQDEVAVYLNGATVYSPDIVTGIGGPAVQHEVLTALRAATVLDDLADV